MASKCSIAPALVWNWVIEALATSEQPDISTLLGLVEAAPALSGDAGKHTREILSLRILGNLFDNEAALDDANTSKIRIDASERCEDVLKRILHETSEPMTTLEKEKWDVASFLKRKRSSLPKCSLTKLKEVLFDDNDPRFASLKEKSKIVISNASEDTSLVNDDELPLNPRKDKNNIQENKLQDDSVPQETFIVGDNKRVSVDSMENLEFVVKSKDENKFQENEIVPEETYTGGHNRTVSVDSMGNLGTVVKTKDPDFLQPNNGKANDDDDGRTDIAAKKEAFLNTIGQDSLTLTEWSEIELCMKCNKSGELLLCSSDSCPLRFHESCLGSTVTLEENGEFFCPFCAYSRAISKYQEAKRNASLARKKLQAFSNFTVKPRPNKPSTKPSELGENVDIEMGDNTNCMSNDKEDPRSTGANCMSNEKESQRSTGDNCMSNDKESQKSTDVDCMSNDKESQRSTDDNCMSNNKEKQRSTGVNDDEETTELLQNPIPQPTTPKQKYKEKESQRSTDSSLTRRLRKRKAKHAPPPPVPMLRRRKLPWTTSEVEILKEGVERYSSGNNAKIPWKEILDFGHNVFNKGRTTIDLKDKWRNICK